MSAHYNQIGDVCGEEDCVGCNPELLDYDSEESYARRALATEVGLLVIFTIIVGFMAYVGLKWAWKDYPIEPQQSTSTIDPYEGSDLQQCRLHHDCDKGGY